MKQTLVLLLVVLLAWGVWQLLDRGDDPQGDGLDGDSYIDEPFDDPVDLKGVPTSPEDAMVGVGEVGTKPDSDGTEGGAARAIDVTGRVVDTRRRPVPDASVELRAGGQIVARATTDGDGAFQLPAQSGRHGRAVRGTLLARREGYGAGTQSVWLAEAGTQPAEAIVLEPAHKLRARVTMDGGPARFAQVAVGRRHGGQLTPFGVRRVQEDGTVVFEGLAEGLYEIYATQPGRGRGFVRARLPQQDGELAQVELGGERLLDVIVEDAVTGEAIPDAILQVGDKRTLPRPTGPGYLPPLVPVKTDRSGRATVRGLGGDETIYVNAEAAGYVGAVWWQASRQVARPGVSEITVRMRKPRQVTFPVYAGDIAPPEDGTPLRVQVAGRMATDLGDMRGRIDGSYAVVEGLPPTPVTGALLAPGGLRASFKAPLGTQMGNAIEFRAPRAVRIRIVDPGGSPVGGVALRLNPLDGIGRGPTATTDDDGLATFEGIAADKAGVHLRVSDSPWGGPLLGRVDLTSGEEEHTFELLARLSFVLRIRLDGERMLPASYTLTAGSMRVPGEDILEDPTAGELQVTLRPPTEGQSFDLQVIATGRLPARVRVDPGASGAIYDVDLAAAGRIVARVNAPTDGTYSLGLEKLDPENDTWRPATGGVMPGIGAPETGDGVHAYDGLAEGRYRLVESRSGYTSKPIEVASGGGEQEIAVDLSGSVDLIGKVVAPAGTNMTQARVRVVGRHDPAQNWSGVRVSADGTFRLRALRGESLELSVSHPLLAPAEQGGRTRVTAGRGTPTLRLVAGPEALFRVAGFERAGGPLGAGVGGVQVKLYRGGLGDDLVLAVQPMAVDGQFVFGGFPPGTYTLWLGFGTKHAPYVRTGVSLERGRTDLGTITPSAGSTLVIALQGAGEGGAYWASVTSEGKPSYARHASRGGTNDQLRVPGLGKGTFRVLVRAADPRGTRVLHEATIKLDGDGETRLEVDAR